MKIQSKALLKELTALTVQHLAYAKKLQTLPIDLLMQKPTPNSWNALECIEHLNRYANFYHPEIEKRISGKTYNSIPEFKSGWLGNYFAKSMWPKKKLNKMKTFASMNPVNSTVNATALNNFITHQQTLLHLLKQCSLVNLNKIKTSISISSLIKLKLGDTLRIVIYHNERHIRQAENAIQKSI